MHDKRWRKRSPASRTALARVLALALIPGLGHAAQDVRACSGARVALSGDVLAQASTETAVDPVLHQTASELKAAAQASGRPVRVIIEVMLPTARGVQPESVADPQRLDETKAQLLEVMRDAGAVVAQSIEATPLVVLELTAPQIDVLLSTDLVKSIQEDRPEGLY